MSLTPNQVATTPPAAAPRRQALYSWLRAGWSAAGFNVPFPDDGWDACPVAGADLTHKAALVAARALKAPPYRVASTWVAHLVPHPDVVGIDVVGPGHVNLTLTDEALLACLAEGAPLSPIPVRPPTLVEFVSANPTGPLHLGHARQAVLGSTLTSLLRHHGWCVGTEFYSNDAGNQIQTLVQSLQLRMLQQQGQLVLFERARTLSPSASPTGEGDFYVWDEQSGPAPKQSPDVWSVSELTAAFPGAHWFPLGGYHGPDIIELARQALANGVSATDFPALESFAVATIKQWQSATLSSLGVHFDGFASEQSLHATGQVAGVVESLRPFAYQALSAHQESAPPPEGAQPAWFLRTTTHGDDKDRVMEKSDGAVPYFIPDVAYHMDKLRRGWQCAINIQGSDHHGTLARLRSGIQFLGGPIDYPQALFHTMVSVLRDGKPLVASKRAGTALPADDLIGLIGPDAFRMSLLSSGPNSELTIDIDAWQQQGLGNPVYAIQYACARLNALAERAHAATPGSASAPDFSPVQRELAKQLLVFPDRLLRAALSLDPTRPAQLMRELASQVHSAYEHAPRMVDLDLPSRAKHGALFAAALDTLRVGAGILGITAPLRMEPVSTPPAP